MSNLSVNSPMGLLQLSFDPDPTLYIPAVIVGAVCWLIYAGLQLRRVTELPKLVQPALAACVVILLLLALLQPSLTLYPQGEEWELIVLVDVSQSTQRPLNIADNDKGPWMQAFVRQISELSLGKVQVFAFAESAVRSTGEAEPVANLWQLATVNQTSIRINANGTNIEAALEQVLKFSSTQRPTTALLISDGLATQGNALAMARQLGRRGIPVHVLPLVSASTGIGVVAADLPPEAKAHQVTHLRAVLANPGLNSEVFSTTATVDDLELATRSWELGTGNAPMRRAIHFEKPGVHAVNFRMTNSTGRVQNKTFFSFVTAPVKITVVGDAGLWSKLLDPARYQVTEVAVDAEFPVVDQDIVILNGVKMDALNHRQLGRIASAVKAKALGLLLVNGKHTLADTEPTVAMSYEGSVLDPWLPTTNKPRPKQVEPLGREIIVLLDASGSMESEDWKYKKAKEITIRIIQQLRPADYLQLIAFSDKPIPLINTKMTADNRREAIKRIPARASGGTAPDVAFKRVTSKGRCGMFFISDIDFKESLRSHACATTVFAVGAKGNLQQVAKLGELHKVSEAFDTNEVELGFFREKPRKKYFESGRFKLDWLAKDAEMNPGLPLDGNAISFSRPGTKPVLLRPHPHDPVLVYTDKEKARVASFLSELPSEWVGESQPRQAIDHWLRRLLSWSERDRYRIEASLSGREVSITVMPLSYDRKGIRLSNIELQLKSADGKIPLMKTRRHSHQRFSASLMLTDNIKPGWGTLRLKEVGADAISRLQEIPFYIPDMLSSAADSSDSEAWSQGTNIALLQSIAEFSGGVFNPAVDSIKPWQVKVPNARWSLWIALVTLAALVLLLLVYFDRNYV